jgi:hypothetical protein
MIWLRKSKTSIYSLDNKRAVRTRDANGSNDQRPPPCVPDICIKVGNCVSQFVDILRRKRLLRFVGSGLRGDYGLANNASVQVEQ